jgi:excisionase family DNA binding protein
MEAKVSENNGKKVEHWITNPEPRLLTIPQAARYLSRSPHTIRQMVYARQFPIIQEGERSKIWIDRLDLDKWTESRKGFI